MTHRPPLDDHQRRADARELHALGYAQELFRTMGSKKATPCGAMISTGINSGAFDVPNWQGCEESF